MAKQETTGERHWYAVHTYAGYENAVVRNLKQRIESLGMQERIFDAVVPTEIKVKIKRGKRVEERERIYPGYVLVDMIVDDESWYVVRNTPRVTCFVGSGVVPVPLTPAEVEDLFARMNDDKSEHDVLYEVGETVRVIDGPFNDLEGKVDSVDKESGRVRVMVSMFGRDTPVELDFIQVERI